MMTLENEAQDRVAKRREQILDAAYRVFAEKGYDAATMTEFTVSGSSGALFLTP